MHNAGRAGEGCFIGRGDSEIGLQPTRGRRPIRGLRAAANADSRLAARQEDTHETTADIVAYYGRARSAADEAIDELDLEVTGTAWFGEAVSMRWVLIHMIEETARHSGHMDIMRELIDGATGDHLRD